MATGDFNGDGKLDVAVANPDANTVSILLGDGTGRFTMVSSVATGVDPSGVAVGDFNGDGKLDLAVANTCGTGICLESPGSVSILLGDGTGKFSLASSPVTELGPNSVAVGDFNGDGKLDLAVSNGCGNSSVCGGPGTVSVLLGDGTGNFTLASTPLTGQSPSSVALGDYNRDGKLDLAIANESSGTISILLGDGTGNFSLASSPATCVGECAPTAVAAGDFNGDGNLDLAVSNYYGQTLSVLLGDGTGSFSLASSLFLVFFDSAVEIGDLNADGKLDLAGVNYQGFGLTDTASILLGDGAGNFTVAASPEVGSSPVSLALGDFNGDGYLDLAVADSFSSGFRLCCRRPSYRLRSHPQASVSATRALEFPARQGSLLSPMAPAVP